MSSAITPTIAQGIPAKGATNLTSVPAGYVGEKITWATAPTDFNITGTESDWTNATITLTAGTWLVIANISAYASASASAGDTCGALVKITDSSNNQIGGQQRQLWSTVSGSTISTTLSFAFVESLTASKTYKIRALENGIGTPDAKLLNDPGFEESDFFAIRIA